MSKKIFISFEGLDGSGKTTQLKMFVEFLKKKGLKVLFIDKHPIFRDMTDMFYDEFGCLDDVSMMLNAMCKCKYIDLKVTQAFLDYDIVIVDRYIDTVLAYAGLYFNDAERKNFMENVFSLMNYIRIPDLTYYVDTPPLIALKRKNGGIDNIETGNNLIEDAGMKAQSYLSFQGKAHHNFQTIERCHERIVRLNGVQQVHEIHQQIIDHFFKFKGTN